MASGFKVGVVGNCQARPIAQMLVERNPDIEIAGVTIVHLAKDDEKDSALSAFGDADLILSQRVANDYPTEFVQTDRLSEEFGERVVVWPNLYYRGYNPELRYLRGADRRPLQGPLGDYHLATIHDAWMEGGDAAEAIRRVNSVEFNAAAFGDVPDASLRDLAQREAECDVQVSDWIADYRWNSKLFFTFNHPARALLEQLVRRIESIVDLPPRESIGRSINGAEPLGRWRAPTNSWIRSAFAPSLDEATDYQGSAVSFGPDDRPVAGDEVTKYDVPGLVHTFYDVYDRSAARPGN